MLGDDDGLLRGFLRSMRAVIERFEQPDIVYTNGLLFAYPGVLPGYPDGFLEPYAHGPFFGKAREPFLLDPAMARDLARQSMNFKMLFTFNMQHAIVSRQFIDRLARHGPFFQSPYPDFYAMNVAFLTARRIVVHPQATITVGISPKSFGFYYFNDQERKGVDFLNNLPDAETNRRMGNVILPGLADKTSWLIAMETILANYGKELPLRVGYARYRYLQTLYVYARWVAARRNGDARTPAFLGELEELRRKLAPWERATYLPALRLAALAAYAIPPAVRSRVVNAAFRLIGRTPDVGHRGDGRRYENMLDVFERAGPAGS
jgi:hypothetical protein